MTFRRMDSKDFESGTFFVSLYMKIYCFLMISVGAKVN